jgi:NTP pyrophosphatase (non-canonical NTP hydrolase)
MSNADISFDGRAFTPAAIKYTSPPVLTVTTINGETVKFRSATTIDIEGDPRILGRMSLTDYQTKAMSTAIYQMPIIYPALKLNGEAGEVAEKVGKAIRDDGGEFTAEKKAELAKEIGDVMWYCAALARDIGYDLEDIARMNLNKLASRMARGVIQGSGDNR